MDVIRLGDVIDDYCTRCHLLTNHSVVAIIGEEVKKVRCRTCNHEHDFRRGKGGQKKKKLSAYEQVLAAVTAGKPGEAPAKPESPRSPSHRRTRSLSPRNSPRR